MDDDGSELNTSLARLRMFLAPHKSTLGEETTHDETARAEATYSNRVDEFEEKATCVPIIVPDKSLDDLDAHDLSVLAEHMATAVKEVGLCEQQYQQDNLPQKPNAVLFESEREEDQAISCNSSIVDLEPTSNNHPISPTVEPLCAIAPLEVFPTVSPIHPQTKEFVRVKHLLQCSLPPHYHLHDDLIMWDMKNPPLVAQYEQQTKGLLELDTWVTVEELSAAMAMVPEDTRDAQSTMKFTTGVLPLAGDPSTKQCRKQLVLCRIAVGRSLVVDYKADTHLPVLPNGYHSYYLRRPTDTSTTYTHEYILHNALQILPLFLVRFSFSAIELYASKPCALCEKQGASVVCKACEAELCVTCDNDVHSANKLVSRHKRVPVRSHTVHRRSRYRHDNLSTICGDDMDAIVTKQVEDSMLDFTTVCRLHSKKVEFFCPLCQIPVCVNCKMIGDHSSGDKGTHRLLSIADAYGQCLRESMKADPLVESRRTVITSKLELIERSRQALHANRDMVATAIREQCEVALARLSEEVNKKESVLDGESYEYVRQLQHIDWLDDCLETQRLSCGILEFLSTWNQHKMVRAEQRDFPTTSYVPMNESVKADLQLMGRLIVTTGDQYEARTSFTCEADANNIQVMHSGDEGGKSEIDSLCSVRRTSDSEIRRKLLSMKPNDQSRSGIVRSANSNSSPLVFNSSSTMLSARGMKMMEEIRKELLSNDTGVSVPTKSSSKPHHRSTMMSITNPTATLRGFSIQPIRRKSYAADGSSPKQRPGTVMWSTLLSHELSLGREESIYH